MSELDKYLKHGHHYSCQAHGRKDDPKYPCNCGHDKAVVELDQIIAELDEARVWEKFHPRAIKLLRKRRNFVVVASDEDYFMQVYDIIRDEQKAADIWTAKDEKYYQQAVKEFESGERLF